MKILVTGGAGFIGSNLVDQLVNEGHDVLAIDNFSTGKRSYCNENARYIHMSILDERLPSIFDNFHPEIVIHLSAQVSVASSITEPMQDAEANILGTIAILQQCVRLGVRKIIFASSAAVYGNPVYLGLDEDHPVSPVSPYGLSKYSCEQYIQLYSKMYDLDYTILRFANVYGERQDKGGEGGVISIFMKDILEGRKPVIYGDGLQTRDFIYVGDVVRASIAALNKGSKGIFNISTNEATSINDLLDMLCDCVGVKTDAIRKPARCGDIKHSWLINSLAKKQLNWYPIYSVKDGLLETYKKYINRIQLAK